MKLLLFIPLLFLSVVYGQIGRYPFAVATGGSTYLTVLQDDNTIGWFKDTDVANITKDATDSLSVWADTLGGTISFRCANNTNDQPVWTSSGVVFNGVAGESTLESFDTDYDVPAIDQPLTIYLVVKQVTWTADDYVFYATNGFYTRQRTITPRLRVYWGAAIDNDNLSVNTLGIITIILDGASAKYQINETTEMTGTASASYRWDDFTIGSKDDNTGNSNIIIREMIFRKVNDDGNNRTLIYNYLKDKYGL